MAFLTNEQRATIYSGGKVNSNTGVVSSSKIINVPSEAAKTIVPTEVQPDLMDIYYKKQEAAKTIVPTVIQPVVYARGPREEDVLGDIAAQTQRVEAQPSGAIKGIVIGGIRSTLQTGSKVSSIFTGKPSYDYPELKTEYVKAQELKSKILSQPATIERAKALSDLSIAMGQSRLRGTADEGYNVAISTVGGKIFKVLPTTKNLLLSGIVPAVMATGIGIDIGQAGREIKNKDYIAGTSRISDLGLSTTGFIAGMNGATKIITPIKETYSYQGINSKGEKIYSYNAKQDTRTNLNKIKDLYMNKGTTEGERVSAFYKYTQEGGNPNDLLKIRPVIDPITSDKIRYGRTETPARPYEQRIKEAIQTKPKADISTERSIIERSQSKEVMNYKPEVKPRYITTIGTKYLTKKPEYKNNIIPYKNKYFDIFKKPSYPIELKKPTPIDPLKKIKGEVSIWKPKPDYPIEKKPKYPIDKKSIDRNFIEERPPKYREEVKPNFDFGKAILPPPIGSIGGGDWGFGKGKNYFSKRKIRNPIKDILGFGSLKGKI